VRSRRHTVAVFVGLAMASFVVLLFIGEVMKGNVSLERGWKPATLVVGVAFGIGWVGAHIVAWSIADRRRAMILGLLLFAAMGLFPPWVQTFSPPGAPPTTTPAGYHPIFDPPMPERGNELAGVRIDVSRLAIQWAVLAALAGAAYVATRPWSD
jgi:hypothetical protein